MAARPRLKGRAVALGGNRSDEGKASRFGPPPASSWTHSRGTGFMSPGQRGTFTFIDIFLKKNRKIEGDTRPGAGNSRRMFNGITRRCESWLLKLLRRLEFSLSVLGFFGRVWFVCRAETELKAAGRCVPDVRREEPHRGGVNCVTLSSPPLGGDEESRVGALVLESFKDFNAVYFQTFNTASQKKNLDIAPLFMNLSM